MEFAKNIKQAFSESCYSLAMQNREKDAGYQSALDEHSKLFDTIRDKLGKDRKTHASSRSVTKPSDEH